MMPAMLRSASLSFPLLFALVAASGFACGGDDVTAVDSGIGTVGLDDAMVADDANVAPDAAPDAMTIIVDSGVDAGVVDSGQADAATDAGLVLNCDDYMPSGTATATTCDDFDTIEPDWVPEGGTWTSSAGVYRGQGPTMTSSCATSEIVASTYTPIEARDVRILSRFRSTGRPDKALVLRWGSLGDRIELNFRGQYTNNNPGDLIVQERLACAMTQYTSGNEVSVPHMIGSFISVEVLLVGTQLTVYVDGQMVLDRSFPAFSNRVGRAGVGVIGSNINTAVAEFEYIVIESLDQGS